MKETIRGRNRKNEKKEKQERERNRLVAVWFQIPCTHVIHVNWYSERG